MIGPSPSRGDEPALAWPRWRPLRAPLVHWCKAPCSGTSAGHLSHRPSNYLLCRLPSIAQQNVRPVRNLFRRILDLLYQLKFNCGNYRPKMLDIYDCTRRFLHQQKWPNGRVNHPVSSQRRNRWVIEIQHSRAICRWQTSRYRKLTKAGGSHATPRETWARNLTRHKEREQWKWHQSPKLATGKLFSHLRLNFFTAADHRPSSGETNGQRCRRVPSEGDGKRSEAARHFLLVSLAINDKAPKDIWKVRWRWCNKTLRSLVRVLAFFFDLFQ